MRKKLGILILLIIFCVIPVLAQQKIPKILPDKIKQIRIEKQTTNLKLEEEPGLKSESPRPPLEEIKDLVSESQAYDDLFVKLVSKEKVENLFLDELDLKQTLRMLAKAAGINLYLDDGITSRKVSLFIEKADIKEIIDMIIKTHGLSKVWMDKNTLIVFPVTKAEDYLPQSQKVFYLSYASPKDVLQFVKGISRTIKVYINEKIDAVIVYGTKKELEIAENLIKKIDKKPPQVLIKITLLEYTGDIKRDLGFEIGESISSKTKEYLLETVRTFTKGDKNLPVLLSLLDQSQKARVLARPTLKVLEKEKSRINIGDRIPIEISTTQTTSGVATTQKQVEWQDAGVKFEIEVQKIHPEGSVSISVDVEVSNITAFSSAGYPFKRIRNANTVIRLKDGETVVMAGLINNVESKKNINIPVLSKIPVIGSIFRRHNKDATISEIVMLLTPEIIWENTENENPEVYCKTEFIGDGNNLKTYLPNGSVHDKYLKIETGNIKRYGKKRVRRRAGRKIEKSVKVKINKSKNKNKKQREARFKKIYKILKELDSIKTSKPKKIKIGKAINDLRRKITNLKTYIMQTT